MAIAQTQARGRPGQASQRCSHRSSAPVKRWNPTRTGCRLRCRAQGPVVIGHRAHPMRPPNPVSDSAPTGPSTGKLRAPHRECHPQPHPHFLNPRTWTRRRQPPLHHLRLHLDETARTRASPIAAPGLRNAIATAPCRIPTRPPLGTLATLS